MSECLFFFSTSTSITLETIQGKCLELFNGDLGGWRSQVKVDSIGIVSLQVVVDAIIGIDRSSRLCSIGSSCKSIDSLAFIFEHS